jgi:uncharacterized protein YkwD
MVTRRSILSLVAVVTARAAAESDQRLARRIFQRINEIRTKSGSEPLAWSEAVAECAREQSRRKVALRFPGHNDPERGDVAERLNTAGIRWSRCGENIFMERGYEDPVNYAVVSWWYSEGHRTNLLDPNYTSTGVGLAQAHDKTWYATQIFLTPPAPPAARSRR